MQSVIFSFSRQTIITEVFASRLLFLLKFIYDKKFILKALIQALLILAVCLFLLYLQRHEMLAFIA